jgi:hypothetical protein
MTVLSVNTFASESLSTVLEKVPQSKRPCQVFEAHGLPPQLNRSFWRTLDYFGWAMRGGSFVLQASQGRGTRFLQATLLSLGIIGAACKKMT